MTLLRLFCCGDRFAAQAVTSLSGFLLLHQPKVYRPGKRGEFSLGRKNKNGRSRPHVNKYINQKGRLLRKQHTARSEKSAQKEALRQDIPQQDSPQQMVQRFAIRFLNDKSYETLEAALKEKDVDSAFRAAHTLKGVCVNLGFDKLYEVSSALTEKLRAKELDGTDVMFEKVKEQYDITVNAIRKLQ